ncbi:hypothetical protein TrispH2_003980 [Trichoplax sp. H2]|uniref:Uncharacterized protein n=1 Tax=Trichoplax adhaerens TaxID=10228 RepID=B3RNR2_TRIAD|nr:predicted protein [Trichoplax adhaerens]EDV28058.1 predicted protein [Trichoplax adhaerens]RDD43357.1 hypothetical protein TrispH2_003980 [Trichoplax sp. H2]|eukprot:XP_002109892.1 predicted protein [Trichoplax adhaerens]
MEGELNEAETEILEELTSSDKFIDDMCRLNTKFDDIKEQLRECTEKFERIEHLVKIKEAIAQRNRLMQKIFITVISTVVIAVVPFFRQIFLSVLSWFYTALIRSFFWTIINYFAILWDYTCNFFQYNASETSEQDFMIGFFQTSK